MDKNEWMVGVVVDIYVKLILDWLYNPLRSYLNRILLYLFFSLLVLIFIPFFNFGKVFLDITQLSQGMVDQLTSTQLPAPGK